MGKTRGEVMPHIEGHRRSIREHIDKYNRYDGYYKQDALNTINQIQKEIQKLKDQCNVSIESSWEDYWTP